MRKVNGTHPQVGVVRGGDGGQQTGLAEDAAAQAQAEEEGRGAHHARADEHGREAAVEAGEEVHAGLPQRAREHRGRRQQRGGLDLGLRARGRSERRQG